MCDLSLTMSRTPSPWSSQRPGPVRCCLVTESPGLALRVCPFRGSALLLTVLAGLFAMHVVGANHANHGSGHHRSVSVLATVGHEISPGGHDGAEPGTEWGTTLTSAGPRDEGVPSSGECLAVLGLLVCMSVAAAVAARAVATPVALGPASAQRLVHLGRLLRPPWLCHLSILRC